MLILLMASIASASPCEDGRVTVDDAGHCCWEGQRWDTGAGICAGRPTTCPADWSLLAEPQRGSEQTWRCAPRDGLADRATPAPPSAVSIAPGETVTLGRHLSIGDPVILGALTQVDINKGLLGARRELAACADRLLADQPGAEGRVVLKFIINEDGTVARSSTKSTTLHESATEGCLNAALTSARFHAPEGGIVIANYSFYVAPDPDRG